MIKKSLKIPKGGNQNPYIEEEQTAQWPKEKGQKEKDKRTNNDLQNIHIKLKIEQHEPHWKPGANSCDPKG